MENRLDIPEQKILIVGNRSYRNLWDELILLWTIKLLQEQDKQILISAYDPTRLQEFLKQFIDITDIVFLHELPKWIRSVCKYIFSWRWKERKQFRQVDGIIIGWGEILTEENHSSYRYWLASILPCPKKIPLYLMGWIQIPKKRINKWLFTIILKRTKKIFARDHESVSELKAYGFEQVEFFMDTSYFAYDWGKLKWAPSQVENPQHRNILQKAFQFIHNITHHAPVVENTESQKYIVVNLNKNGEKFVDDILADIQMHMKQGYAVYFVPMAKGKHAEYTDLIYYDKLVELLKNSDIEISQQFQILDRENDFHVFVRKLAQAEIVISTRLHLFLIASFLWVPTKVYPYQKKILKMKNLVDSLSRS